MFRLKQCFILWCWFFCLCWGGLPTAHAGFTLYGGNTNSTPSPAGNERVIELPTPSYTSEDTNGYFDLTYQNESLVRQDLFLTVTEPGGLDGMLGRVLRLNSSSSDTNNPTSVTMTFSESGSAYVGFRWGVYYSPTNQDKSVLTLTMTDGSTVTLSNCQVNTNSNCIGYYMPTIWQNALQAQMNAWNIGDGSKVKSVYVYYVPDTGKRIRSIKFSVLGCPNCSGIGTSNEYQYVDYFAYALVTLALHHLEVTHSTSSITSGQSSTFTIKACVDLACTALNTDALLGTLSISGAGLTANYPSGANFSLPQDGTGTVTVQGGVNVVGSNLTATVALTALSRTPTYTPTVFCGFGVAASSSNACTMSVLPVLDHIRVTSTASSWVYCNPIIYTITACANADCSVLYTAGVSGTLTVSGVSVSYPDGQAFSITGGASSTTWNAQAAAAGTATVSASVSSPATTIQSPSYWCGMGTTASQGGSCNITTQSAGFLVETRNATLVAGYVGTIKLSAIQVSDINTICEPSFKDVTKSINFKCTYTNPTTGTLPIVVRGYGVNAAGNIAAACDGSGRDFVLNFNSGGSVNSSMVYEDVGQMNIDVLYTGTGAHAGVVMEGSTSFVSTPDHFDVVVAAGNKVAGQAFSATVNAKNLSNATTPNFGRETSPASVTLGFVRSAPMGSGASNGSFSGSVGAFSSGSATASNLIWSEVGQGDVTAVLSSGTYLGTSYAPAGSAEGTSWIDCAAMNQTCVIPSGATATVRFGTSFAYSTKTNQTGNVTCSTENFGNPAVGYTKRCSYLVTSGSWASGLGTVGPVKPHYLAVTVPAHACGTFTYSGQPFTASIKAYNASNAVVSNYDGTANTSPNFAKAVTLSVINNGSTGSLSNGSVAASSFSAGVATVSSPAFTFTDKLTPVTAITLRAVDADGISSIGFTEEGTTLRSGRLRFSNAFGSKLASLTLPIQAQYWSGKSWILNSADSCTTVPAAAVALSGYTNRQGGVGAWTTTASAISINNGHGSLVLSAPTGNGEGSVFVATNLGSTTADNACTGSNPTTTPANRAWLRSRNGSCATTYDRDPSARASFGLVAPESNKKVHIKKLQHVHNYL